jgi:uncharacterized RDD family membrane protein YckC
MKYKKRQEIIQNESLTLASFGKRTLAIIIDFIILIIIFVLLQIIIQLLGFDLKNINVEGFTHINIESENIGNTGKSIIRAIYICIPTIYFTLTTYHLKGQTIGKKILKIKVVSLYHNKIGFWHCLERSLGYAASSLELGLGFIQAFWNVNRMTLHDKIGETIVVQCEPKTPYATIAKKAKDKTTETEFSVVNSFLDNEQKKQRTTYMGIAYMRLDGRTIVHESLLSFINWSDVLRKIR